MIFSGIVFILSLLPELDAVFCITCRSYENQLCGLRSANSTILTSLLRKCPTDANQCFTYVLQTPGAPHITRGCGWLSCERLSERHKQLAKVCDQNNNVRGRDSREDTGVDEFTFTKNFTAKGPPAVLEYCRRTYSYCNGQLLDYYNSLSDSEGLFVTTTTTTSTTTTTKKTTTTSTTTTRTTKKPTTTTKKAPIKTITSHKTSSQLSAYQSKLRTEKPRKVGTQAKANLSSKFIRTTTVPLMDDLDEDLQTTAAGDHPPAVKSLSFDMNAKSSVIFPGIQPQYPFQFEFLFSNLTFTFL